MNLAELCDWVYYIHLERLERRVVADRTGVIVLQSMVEGKLEIPDPDEARERYDEMLNEEPPKVFDDAMGTLRKALGV